jgi:small-conductance mechanosensitive channel
LARASQALYGHHQKAQAMIDASTFALLGGIVTFIGISLLISLIIIKALSDIAKRSQLPKDTIRDIQRGILTIWLALTVVWILQSLGLTSLFSSLTLTGIVGLGITLALQSTLSNLLSGVWLLRDNILRLGDIIKIADVKGTVIKLGFRSTWLKTSEGNIVVMSNSTLYNGPFTNFTATERLSKKTENKQ